MRTPDPEPTHAMTFEINHSSEFDMYFVCTKHNGPANRYLSTSGSLAPSCGNGWFKTLSAVADAITLYDERTRVAEERAVRTRRVKRGAGDALGTVGLKLVSGVVRDQYGEEFKIEPESA